MIVVDVETTGLNPQKHSIVSIGALEFSNPKNQFYQECRIWDGAKVDLKALEINGFSKEEISNPSKQSLEELIKNFVDWRENIEDKTIAGQNPFFDRSFLKASAEKYKINVRFGQRIIDLHSLCYTHHLKRDLSPPIKDGRTDLGSDNILNYVGLPDEPKPHNALTGAKMEAEAFSRLIFGKPLLKEFKKFPMPDYLV